MVEYVLAAWLATCLTEGMKTVFCIALLPGKEFRMGALIPPNQGTLYNDGKKDHTIVDWCIRNDGDVDAWANMYYEGDKTVVQLGPGMVPCSAVPGKPIS